jgi:hypothetical protein
MLHAVGAETTPVSLAYDILMGAFNRTVQFSTAILQFQSRRRFSIFDLTLDFRGDYFVNDENLFAGIKDALGRMLTIRQQCCHTDTRRIG